MKTMKYLPNVGEVVSYTPYEGLTIPAYVVNIVDNTYYLYAQNRLVAIQVQHTIDEDPMTGDKIDEYDVIDTNTICDYCVIPEADNLLEGLTS